MTASGDPHAAPEGDEARRVIQPLDQADPTVPMRVDWIEAAVLNDGAPGRLGMAFLPGKHGVSSRYPGLVYRRSLDDDLGTLRGEGITYLLLLVDDEELRRFGDQQIVERAAATGLRVDRYPLPDGSAPATSSAMAVLLSRLRRARSHGEAAIACMGGVGRTGTVAACALVDAGLSADAAIETVRRIRHPDAVETDAQRAFIERYAVWHRSSSQSER